MAAATQANRWLVRWLVLALHLLGWLAGGAARAQGNASYLIVPQTGVRIPDERVRVVAVTVAVRIQELVARTTLEVELENLGPAQAEAVFLLPVGPRAVVHEFTYEGAAAEPTIELLPAVLAQREYATIVARAKDPALLEFAGHACLRSSLFPVPPQSRQRIRVAYDELCEQSGGRVDYVLPRSESLAATVPWTIEVALVTARGVATYYSPSHALELLAQDACGLRLRVDPASARQPGSFRLSWITADEGLGASIFAYPDAGGEGGTFLLLAGLPRRPLPGFEPLPRELTIVIDRSGSMAGDKLEQARRAALRMLSELGEGESFRILDYATDVECFAPAAVPKSQRSLTAAARYLTGLRALGGTNLHDALAEALRPAASPGCQPIVLFLTDGLPTIGATSELAIRALVERGNPYGRRVYTFGVGQDVNAPLLDRLAERTRATSTYVLPGQAVDSVVGALLERLASPLLTGLELCAAADPESLPAPALLDLHPTPLPDLHAGEPLVVLGRYRGSRPIDLRLQGLQGTRIRSFAIRLDPALASTRHAFVPRLWASRRIAWLADRIRQAGADPRELLALGGQGTPFGEIVDEILELSRRYGILSEYTAFLAREGSALTPWSGLRESCTQALESLAVSSRAGAAGVNQGLNLGKLARQQTLDYENRLWMEGARQVEHLSVQQLCDRAFYRAGACWVDGAFVGRSERWQGARSIARGSVEHLRLMERLASEGRAGLLALEGEVLLELDGQAVWIRD